MTAGGTPQPMRSLVVEDNAPDLMATVEGLTQEGFEVLTADHGAGALGLLEQESGIEVVVSGVVMPYGGPGLDLARQVRLRWPRIRFVLTSAYGLEALAGMGADTVALPPPSASA